MPVLEQDLERKYMVVPFDLKKLDTAKEGSFEGYGSIFGNTDAYKDIVAPGAFKKSLKNRMPALLWQHRSDMPIGIYPTMKEDDIGLFVQGELNTDVQQGKEAYSLLKQGALNGLSIGYQALNWDYDEKTGIRTLNQIDLWEVSLVTFPANAEALVQTVKSLPQTEREFDRFLRDAGFGTDGAKTITSKGFKAWQEQRRMLRDGATLNDKSTIAKLRSITDGVAETANRLGRSA